MERCLLRIVWWCLSKSGLFAPVYSCILKSFANKGCMLLTDVHPCIVGHMNNRLILFALTLCYHDSGSAGVLCCWVLHGETTLCTYCIVHTIPVGLPVYSAASVARACHVATILLVPLFAVRACWCCAVRQQCEVLLYGFALLCAHALMQVQGSWQDHVLLTT